ncbi:hypothetical protein AHAS_Ahas17G0169300 [Arachis hypogaea]
MIGMSLLYDETVMAAYIFKKPKSKEDYEEMLYKCLELQMPRGMFLSLCPRYVPHTDIVNTIAWLASLRAHRTKPMCDWFLPSSFADHILQLKPVEAILQTYLGRWMPETDELEHVFVLILEPSHSWYMMVLDVKKGKVLALDICRTNENKTRRERNMRTIVSYCCLPGKPMLSCNAFHYCCQMPDIFFWDISPFTIKDDDTPIWCLYWLQLDGNFNPALLSKKLNEGKVRMRTATNIVNAETNQNKLEVKVNSEMAWRKLFRTVA